MEPEVYDLGTLQERVRAGWSPKYVFFWGHTGSPQRGVGKECFSQWYPAGFTLEGVTYATAEHYMMAQKALLFGDTDAAQQILACRRPAEVKELGRHVRGFDQARWEAHRFDIVVAASRAKFGQNAALRDCILGTASAVLVEASPKDTIWGIGLAEADPRARDPLAWCGLNLLGFALMVARARLAEEHAIP